MDESDAWVRAGQTLSRRELRALRTAPDAEDAPVDDAPVDDAPVDDAPGEDAPADDGQPVPDPWRAAVDWSLLHELPRELPPEAEVDDVRWDGPPVAAEPAPGWSASGAPAGVGDDEAAPAEAPPAVADESPAPSGAPARVPVLRTAFAPATMLDVDPVSEVDEVDEDIVVPAPAGAGGPVAGGDEPGGGLADIVVAPEPLPTLTDLLAGRPVTPAGPAQLGWQGAVRRMTGGLVALRPGPFERDHRAAVTSVQRSLDGPRTVVVINPKGGAHKTTATLLLAATFGQHRGGYTLAWDNNETRGTLGWRSHQARHHNTAVNLLQDLDRFADAGSARVGDLDNYVRSQGSAQFDVLASDEDAASAASIDAFAFRSLHRTLSRFYRVMVVDTGNNMRASNWQAAIEAADQVVIVSTVREDTAQSAAWAIDALRATGHEDVVRRAVTVLSAPAPRRDDRLAGRLHEHFSRLTRTVVDVPYDAALVGGSPIAFDALSRATREAWLRVTSAVAEGLEH